MTLEPGSHHRDKALRATVLVPQRLRIVAVAVAAGLLLPACASSATSSAGPSASATASTAASPAPSPTSAVCQAAADLRASVNALAHVKIGQGTVNEVKSDLADVQEKFTALTAELHGAYSNQTSAVKSALDALKTAVSDLGAQPGTSALRGVATAVGGVTAAVGSLMTSLAPQCGSPSASPSP